LGTTTVTINPVGPAGYPGHFPTHYVNYNYTGYDAAGVAATSEIVDEAS
jgi:hypothetical protein